MKKQLIIGLLLLFSATIQAQENGHYLYLNAGGGLHNLKYDLQNGNEKGAFGYSLNAGYGYYFNKHWGLQTGIGLQSIKSTATLNYMTSAPSTDTDGENYEYRTYYKSWQEQQKLLLLDIPLGLQYRCKLNEKFQLLATVGLKISVPVKTTYKTTGGEIVTSGYYSKWNVELKDMPRHGFNNITDQLTGDVSLKPSCSGFADLGALYGLSSRLDLYAGGYVDYGLNNILKSNNKLVYQQDGIYNGVLASNQTDKARTVSLGLKVGVLWHFGNKKAVTKPAIPAKREEVLTVAPKAAAIEKAPEVKEVPKTAIAEQPVVKATPVPVVLQKDDAYTDANAIAASVKIRFKFNSSLPSKSENAKIKSLSKILKANPGISLHIVGHTDSFGSPKVNKKLGLQRAGNVRYKFLKQGVPGSQLHKEAKLFDRTLSSKSSKENRVVTLTVEYH